MTSGRTQTTDKTIAGSERTRLRDLRAHPKPFVTIAELAEYWLVGRKQLYKQIDAGTLRAIRLGPRLLRIRTVDALDFERRANIRPTALAEPAERIPAADPAGRTAPPPHQHRAPQSARR